MIDEPKFPHFGPTYPALESFRITWEATGDLQTFEDKSKYFNILGYPARSHAEFVVSAPALNFGFQGTATSTFALLGREVNGQYYVNGESPPTGSVLPSLGAVPSPSNNRAAPSSPSAPGELSGSASGSLAGNRGGAFASYTISQPGTSPITLTLTYAPHSPATGNGIGLEVYENGARLAGATDSGGSGTLSLTVTPTTGPLTVKVDNYGDGTTISYSLARS